MANLKHSHDILRSITTLGCEDEALCYAAYRIYIHLIEEKNLSNVQYHYDDTLPNGIYLTAQKAANLPFYIIIPALVSEELNFADLACYRKAVGLASEQVEGIMLAICDSCSTVLFYKCTPDLKKIDDKEPSRGKLVRHKVHAAKNFIQNFSKKD